LKKENLFHGYVYEGVRMHEVIRSEVIVYHDETKNAGNENLKGHVLLFVPVMTEIESDGGLFEPQTTQIRPWNEFSKRVEEIREEFKADHKFHFSEISGKKWTKYDEAVGRFVRFGIESLKQKNDRHALFFKLGIIFYENPKPINIAAYGGKIKEEQVLRFEETILRMLIKGAVHYLYDNNHKVKILKIITDGQPYHRRLNEFRVLERLIEEVRDYADISDEAELIHLSSDHKNHDRNTEEYIHANMLQLADMLLGSSIHACLKDVHYQETHPRIGTPVSDKKGIIAYPIREMLDKRKRGRNFRHSSHYKAFTISKSFIRNDQWEFENVMTKEILINTELQQLSLFDF